MVTFTDIGFFPKKDKFCDECLRMVVHGLTCQLFHVTSICIVAIGENPRWRNLVNQEIAKPKNAVLGCPRLFTMAVQAMDCDNTVDE